ncbi:unnamed protein product [Polarella glacialis]|uniref:Uncharacterized protein n=1 Tax=Polarella glacialis TaxID=89957 RepID=A0A813E1L8_POLGL|nr:unnamed protein product [Polarella glacialis]
MSPPLHKYIYAALSDVCFRTLVRRQRSTLPHLNFGARNIKLVMLQLYLWHTMMDAMFMAFSGGEKETAMSMAMKLLMQYIVNLTMGIIGAFVFFVYNVYTLVVSYGESALSGLAFFLLVVVAGMATVGTYLVAIYGTVAGGGIFLLKQAAKQAAVEGGRAGARPRQVQYGGGRVGGQRSHYD